MLYIRCIIQSASGISLYISRTEETESLSPVILPHFAVCQLLLHMACGHSDSYPRTDPNGTYLSIGGDSNSFAVLSINCFHDNFLR